MMITVLHSSMVLASLLSLTSAAGACLCSEPIDMITYSHMDAVDTVVRVYLRWPMATTGNATTNYYMVGTNKWYKNDVGSGQLVVKASSDSSCAGSTLPKHQNYILFGSIQDEVVPGYAGEIPVLALDGCRPQKLAPSLILAEWQTLIGYSSSPTSAPSEQQTVSPTDVPTIAPSTSSPTATPDTFEMHLDATALIPDADVPFFQVAVNRWQSVINGGIPDFTKTSKLGPPPPGCTYPTVIDDLYVCASYDITPSDGPGGFVGFSTPTYWRLPSYLPISAAISMDSADIDVLKEKGLYNRVILHELGHVLGIGTQWKRTGIAGEISEGCPYFGPKANAEYNTLTGCASVPTETDGGAGTHCQHWDEMCLGDELMTGFVGGRTQLSRVSIASLEDLGYEVNYANSDYLGPDDINPSCMCDDRRMMFEREYGAVTRLNHPSGRRRKLSTEAHDLAMAKGAEILETQHQQYAGMETNSTEFEFAADKVVTVLVLDGDDLFGVIVKRGA